MYNHKVTTTTSSRPLDRFKSLFELNYKKPVNGNFNDCTKEILKEIGTEDYEADEDLNKCTQNDY